MLNSSAIDSAIFRRLTNRQKPKLVHPTAATFDLNVWEQLLSEDNLSERDRTLVHSAILLGMNLNMLRTRYIQRAFEGLSGQEIATFTAADANRAYAILRSKGREAQSATAGSTGYISTLGQMPVDVGPDSTLAGIDDLNTAVVDTLAHWFARAKDAPESPIEEPFDYNRAGALAQASLSLEHALREVWQEILWEGFILSRVADGWSVTPGSFDEQALWRVWDWREQALLNQYSILNRHLESAVPPEQLSFILTRTAASVDDSDVERTIILGAPSDEQAAHHRSAMDILDSAYVAPFLDLPLTGGGTSITPRLLERAICVLQDMAELLIPPEADIEYKTAADIERLSCSLSRDKVVTLIAEALGMDSAMATDCVDRLTSKPFDDVGPIFRNGLWHRPLVATRDGQTLQMIAGALVWGSPLRRVERWLQEEFRADMSKTPLGLQYEAHLRQRLQEALTGNEILSRAAGHVASIPNGQASEEVDGLIRIGSTVLVLEIKCLLAPADPIDRHDYILKLESACAQAVRKATWLQDNIEQIASRVGLPTDGTPLRVVPLVVVNQSNGTGCKFGNCVVVDAHFLRLYLSSGEYMSGGALDLQTPGRTGFKFRRLYSNASEAEIGIPSTFEVHPGLVAFRAAVRWTVSPIPLAGGETLRITFPTMDVASYTGAMPNPDELLGKA